MKKIRNILTQKLQPKLGKASIDDFASAASETLKQVSSSDKDMKTSVESCFLHRFIPPSKVPKELTAEAKATDLSLFERCDEYRKRLAKELLPHLRVVWDFCRKEDEKIFPSGGN